jgi:hypothetical protein
MARPSKEGLDYFPLDVDIDQDDKVIIIIAKYGMQGFGILIKLLMEIYKNGYFYDWTEKEQIIFSSRVSVDINLVKELVNDCIKWGLFNQSKYDEFKILTSKGIQERYLLATSRRVSVDIKKELSLVSVNINPKLSEKTSAKSTQSKRKEIKLNKTKKEDTKKQYAEFVKLTQDEYEKLVGKFGEQGTKDRIENLNFYKGSKGVKYESDYLTILSWERKNNPKINTGTHTKQNAIDFNRLEALLEDE